jgi:tetratricopeptide (TPR) repeat protein
MRREGRAQEAVALHQAVRDVRQRIDAPAAERYHAMENLADDLRVLGRCEEAEAEYRAALVLREAAGEHDEIGAAYPHLGLGLCERQRGKRTAAVATLESALRLGGAAEEDWHQQTLALVRLALAMVLRQDEPGSERAAALAAQAHAFWAADPQQHAALLRQYEKWAAGGPATMLVY